MFQEGCSGEGLGRDVGEVLIRVDLVDVNAPCLFSVSNHSVAWGHPFGFGGDPSAAGAVDENSGVGEQGSG